MFIGKWDVERKEDFLYEGSCRIHKVDGISVWFFGVLYNKKTLGYDPAANEAKIIIEIYREKGYTGFARLDGSFTCLLRTPDSAVIFRDHHGTSYQVYYTSQYFSSSLMRLKDMDGFTAVPNYKALSSFLSIGYIETPMCALEGVCKLGAGELLLWRDGDLRSMSLFPSYTMAPATPRKSLEEYAEEYAGLHAVAIQRRIGSSANVGILLSGGYDSGCNLAALRKIYNGDIRSYSIGFKGDNWTELPLARCMSDTFHTIHAEYEIDGSEISSLPDIVEFLGDPFVEGGLMVNYSVMRLIGQAKPDILLGGDGSDQYFGTSGREVALHYLTSRIGMKPLMRLLYGFLNQSGFDTNNSLYRLRFHLDKILHILQGDLFGFPSFWLKDLMLDQDFLPAPDRHRPDTRSFEALYTQHLYKSDVERIINQVILFKAYKMADMFGNNLAFPYMDLDLYRFLSELPVCYKCKGDSVAKIARGHATAKYLLKYHYKPLLPEAITSKKKQGGFAPMPLFFKDDRQRTRIADFILSSSVVGDYLNRKTVERFVRRYDLEVHNEDNWFWYRQNRAIQYFNLLTLAIWWERFIGNKDCLSF